MLALLEVGVHLLDADVDHALRKRLRNVEAALGGTVVFAPTHLALRWKLCGDARDRERLAAWCRNLQRAWRALALALDDPPALELIARGARHITDSGAFFVDAMKATAAHGPLSPQQLREAEAFGRVHDPWPIRCHGKWPIEERFDAYTKLLTEHGASAFARAKGHQRAHEENDVTDTNLTQHIADGAVVATADHHWIESVDATKSVQAPWVRTIPELLNDLGPKGPPFGVSAQRAARRHRPRTRAGLAALERATPRRHASRR